MNNKSKHEGEQKTYDDILDNNAEESKNYIRKKMKINNGIQFTLCSNLKESNRFDFNTIFSSSLNSNDEDISINN